MNHQQAMQIPERCPCGSGKPFALCCAPILQGATAPTAETLMRSRYTANVLGDASHLLSSWHASTRPASLDLKHRPAWLSLEMLATTAGGKNDEIGTVEFRATYRDGQRIGTLHETSRFVREKGRWYYVAGIIHEAPTAKIGRNDPCPCGSGRKAKRCCSASL